jgi:hypothetical protein
MFSALSIIYKCSLILDIFILTWRWWQRDNLFLIVQSLCTNVQSLYLNVHIHSGMCFRIFRFEGEFISIIKKQKQYTCMITLKLLIHRWKWVKNIVIVPESIFLRKKYNQFICLWQKARMHSLNWFQIEYLQRIFAIALITLFLKGNSRQT